MVARVSAQAAHAAALHGASARLAMPEAPVRSFATDQEITVQQLSRRMVLGLGSVVLSSVVLTACGGELQTVKPAAYATVLPADASAEDILRYASERLAETTSVSFALAVDGDTFIDTLGTIRLVSAEGQLLRPDRVATTFKVEILGRTVTLDLITIGEQTWMTDIVKGEWGPAPFEFSYRPDVLFDTQSGLGPVMGRVSGATREANETIDGQAVFHVTADVAGDVVGPMTYYTLHGDPVRADIWVSTATGDLVRARLTEPPGADRPNPATWTLDITNHGEPVVIEAPVTDAVASPSP